MPISWRVRVTRTAISPRFAMRTLRKGFRRRGPGLALRGGHSRESVLAFPSTAAAPGSRTSRGSEPYREARRRSLRLLRRTRISRWRRTGAVTVRAGSSGSRGAGATTTCRRSLVDRCSLSTCRPRWGAAFMDSFYCCQGNCPRCGKPFIASAGRSPAGGTAVFRSCARGAEAPQESSETPPALLGTMRLLTPEERPALRGSATPSDGGSPSGGPLSRMDATV